MAISAVGYMIVSRSDGLHGTSEVKLSAWMVSVMDQAL